jgi:hypothetical protein
MIRRHVLTRVFALSLLQLFLTPNAVSHRFGAIPAFTMASMVQAAK